MPFLLLVALLFGSACRKGPTAPPAIVLSVPYEIDTLDPHARDRLSNASISFHFYEPLVMADAEMGLHPALALRWSNPDLLTWVFELRPGVTFHDGRAFDARDVVYSFERILKDPVLEYGMYVVQITSVKALGPLTVEIKTQRPMGVLLYKISMVGIAPEAMGPELATKVNGTGPYRLVSWKGDQLRLERNERYWGTPPAIPSVTFSLKRSPEKALEDLNRGESHIAICSSRSVAESVARNPDVHILRRTGLFLKYLGFDLSRPRTEFASTPKNPFLSPLVREAISNAIDRPALASKLSTFASPASQFVPPFIFGFNPSLPLLESSTSRAKDLLEKAGYPGGFNVTLHTRSILQEAAQHVAKSLGSVGVRVTVQALPDPEFFTLARAGRLSLYLTRFGCASGDISDVLDAGFHTVDEQKRFGTSNFGAFSDPLLDEEIEKSAEILEAPDRRVSLYRLSERIRNGFLWVPLFYDEDVYAMKKPFVWQPPANSLVLAQEISVSKER